VVEVRGRSRVEIEEGRRGVEIGVGNESSHKVSLVNAGTENIRARPRFPTKSGRRKVAFQQGYPYSI